MVVHVAMHQPMAEPLNPHLQGHIIGEQAYVANVEAGAQVRQVDLIQYVTDDVRLRFPHVLQRDDHPTLGSLLGHRPPKLYLTLSPTVVII